MVTLTERTIMKSRSGVYSDTSENRRKHRVGQKYGAEKQPEDGEKTEKKETDPAKELEAVNKVIAAINEGKVNLSASESMKLVERKNKLEELTSSDILSEFSEGNPLTGIIAEKKFKDGILLDAGIRENDGKYEIIVFHEKVLNSSESSSYFSLKEDFLKKKFSSPQEAAKAILDFKEKERKIFKTNKELSKKETEPKKERVSLSGWERNSLSDVKNYGEKGVVESMSVQSVPNLKEMKYEYSAAVSASRIAFDESEEFRIDSEKLREKKFASPNEAAKAADEFALKWNTKGKQISDGKSIQKRKIELLDKYHQDLEKMNKAHEQEQDRIMKELDDEVDNKKRKELWTSLKEKTNNHNEATNKLWKEYESNLDKLEKEEDTHYDKLSEKEKDDVNLKEETEVYTRVKFDDVPNSGKINLKKYLSEKVRKGVDEKWSNIKNIPTENLKKMEKGLVNDLNKNFEAIKKSQRAELLYSIMKVKGELESRGKETSKRGK